MSSQTLLYPDGSIIDCKSKTYFDIKYEPGEYCFYFGATQTGKTMMFKGFQSQPVHFSGKLYPNNFNMVNYTSIYEVGSLVALHKVMKSLKPKLHNGNCRYLEFDPLIAVLKHANDTATLNMSRELGEFRTWQKFLSDMLYSDAYILNFFNNNSIIFKKVNLLNIDSGEFNIAEMFKEDLETYNIPVFKEMCRKLNYEWTPEMLFEEINAKYSNAYGRKMEVSLDTIKHTAEQIKEKAGMTYKNVR